MSGADLAGTAPSSRPRVPEVEQHGIDAIPAAERSSRPLDLFRIQFGGALTIGSWVRRGWCSPEDVQVLPRASTHRTARRRTTAGAAR